jgi:tetratricopeptide (TPR) repeat protein
MKRSLWKPGTTVLTLAPLLLATSALCFGAPNFERVTHELRANMASPQNEAQTESKRSTTTAGEKQKREDAEKKAKLLKDHLANGNRAMQEAKAIREQLAADKGAQKSALLAKMNADYQTAITEYQEALKNTSIADANAIQPFGLIRLIRNGLISEQKAVQMEAQDKNLPVILGNLGMAYSGAGDYDDAIPLLQQAVLAKPEPATYMQLGTDFGEKGNLPAANATCAKIGGLGPTATDVQAACYKNIAIVLINEGKLTDAVESLRKVTQLAPTDALTWKLLGDALTGGITTKQQGRKLIYVIPPGTVEAYQKYLQLAPNGAYARQVKATLDGFAEMTKGVATTGGPGKTP